MLLIGGNHYLKSLLTILPVGLAILIRVWRCLDAPTEHYFDWVPPKDFQYFWLRIDSIQRWVALMIFNILIMPMIIPLKTDMELVFRVNQGGCVSWEKIIRTFEVCMILALSPCGNLLLDLPWVMLAVVTVQSMVCEWVNQKRISRGYDPASEWFPRDIVFAVLMHLTINVSCLLFSNEPSFYYIGHKIDPGVLWSLLVPINSQIAFSIIFLFKDNKIVTFLVYAINLPLIYICTVFYIKTSVSFMFVCDICLFFYAVVAESRYKQMRETAELQEIMITKSVSRNRGKYMIILNRLVILMVVLLYMLFDGGDSQIHVNPMTLMIFGEPYQIPNWGNMMFLNLSVSFMLAVLDDGVIVEMLSNFQNRIIEVILALTVLLIQLFILFIHFSFFLSSTFVLVMCYCIHLLV